MSDGQTQTLDGGARELRIGQVLNDFLDRRARGEPVAEADLLAQHPDLADDLREHLGLLGDLRQPAESIETLIAQHILTRTDEPGCPAELRAYKITGFLGRSSSQPPWPSSSYSRYSSRRLLRVSYSGSSGSKHSPLSHSPFSPLSGFQLVSYT